MGYQHIQVRTEEPLGRITLDRPDSINTLSLDLLGEVISALDAFSEDPAVRVIIIDGEGRGFSVGHDLNEMIERDRSFYDHLFATCSVMMEKVQSIPQPVIAKVHGIAAAAGCQLVAACDLVVASEDSRFGTTGLKVGLFCSTPMVPLSRAIGRKRAMEMLLTGDVIDAATAADWGLVNRVVPLEALEDETVELAMKIAGYSSEVVGLGKTAFYRQLEMAESDAYAMAKDVIAGNAAIADGQEGMKAFLEKRQPVWTDSAN
ncbi:MAG: enoyl-CoA hydratase [Acidimicrobiia bacterium]|nr:enoyl-CoA hydratase [Acidimicrobiia bacterium]